MQPVRPTRRAIRDLGVAVPTIDIQLHDVDHALIGKAQALPDSVAAGGAERISCIRDSVWFKVKVDDYRGAAHQVADPLGASGALGELDLPDWWIGAAGRRNQDSPQHDFYSRLKSEVGAKGSAHLGPDSWDTDRFQAEVAYLVTTRIQDAVRRAAGASLYRSCPVEIAVGDVKVDLRIRVVASGEAYIAVAARNIVDPKFYAILFSSFPGIEASAWMPEPAPPLNLSPEGGEVVYSTYLPPDVQMELPPPSTWHSGEDEAHQATPADDA